MFWSRESFGICKFRIWAVDELELPEIVMIIREEDRVGRGEAKTLKFPKNHYLWDWIATSKMYFSGHAQGKQVGWILLLGPRSIGFGRGNVLESVNFVSGRPVDLKIRYIDLNSRARWGMGVGWRWKISKIPKTHFLVIDFQLLVVALPHMHRANEQVEYNYLRLETNVLVEREFWNL